MSCVVFFCWKTRHSGSEQVFVFGVAGKSYAYNHIANALRGTWGNDDRLRSHDIGLSQQLQGGHLAGGVHWTGEEDYWKETDYDYEDSLEPWTSEWYGTDGYDDESHLEETGWTEDFYETDDDDPNDSTFSYHYPALLDQTFEKQEGNTSKREAADMSRRTWTQARQLMQYVHRSRGYFPVSKGNMMEVGQGKGNSRGKKGHSSKGKGKRQGKSKGKGKVRRPGPCLLCQGLHWARDCASHHGGNGKRVNSFGKGHKNSSPFRRAYLEGDKHDWITGAGAFAVSAPSLQNFASFDLDGKFILDSGATMSMGGVDSLQRIQEMYAQAGHPVSPLRFFFRERTRERVAECFACTVLALESHILHSSVERAKTSAVGSRSARRFGTCRGPCRLLRVSESLEAGRHC